MSARAERLLDAIGEVQAARRPGGDARRADHVFAVALLALFLLALLGAVAVDTGTYETRFFLADGWLVQQYAVEGSPVSTQGATRLAASGSFSFELDEGLLTVSCDAGTARVALRSGGES